MNTLRKILIGATSAAAVAGLATAASAQNSSSASVGANARLIAPLTITGGNALEFGTIVAPTTASTVSVSTAGVRTSSNSGLLVPTGATPAPGTFSISGEANQSFNIAITATMTQSDVTVDNFSATGCSNDVIAAGTGTGKTATSGTGAAVCTLTVGARLNIDANPTLGAKTGTLTTTVSYN
jgi:hypothetical protein